MHKLYVPENASHPNIFLDLSEGRIEISGKANGSSSANWIQETVNWLKTYWKLPAAQLEIRLRFKQISQEALAQIENLLQTIANIVDPSNRVVVIWEVNNHDKQLISAGNALASRSPFPIKVLD